ncbi:MAG TPA: protein kinase [Gammaproteobacteria bacterium]|nr:protein kinase [Gammaproteobacteria bacterium]
MHAPPFELVQRIDLALFDLWSRAGSTPPPDRIALVRVDSTAELGSLIDLAAAARAKLLVATLAQPPPALAEELVVGPLDVPVGATLRRTNWQQGGHLSFETGIDGRVRYDRPELRAEATTPSLGAYAAQRAADNSALASADADERRWLRFYARESFPTIALRDARTQPDRLRDRVVIAGPAVPAYRTSIGVLSAPELLAQVVAGYLEDRRITGGAFGSAVAWAAAALSIALACLRPPLSRSAIVLAGGTATVGLLAGAGVLFTALDFWLPVAGPVAWVSIAAVAFGLSSAELGSRRAHDIALAEARRAAAEGRLADAWLNYRQVSPTPALLSELYDVACALESNGATREAADLFHRLTQVDGNFRDVAKRLVRCSRPSSDPVAPDGMPAAMGRYQLLEPIARGAMGYVYLGRDPKINRIVALKVVDLAAEFEPAELETASRTFLREAEIAGRLSHPNIVTIFDVGESTGLAYIAMEYLRGHHLSEFTKSERLLPVPTVLDLLSRTADALDYAHAQNVVHRDIKPANIMYDSVSDGLKITDFGIARLIDVSRTKTGIVLGTPAFMSPEQLEGKNVNGHTDLFALGVSLYQLLTGHLPFRGASMTKLMFVIANEPHDSVTSVRPELPQWLDPIIDRALAKDPGDRFQSGAEMAAALRFGVAQLA